MVAKDGQRFEGCWLEGQKDGPGFVVGQDGDWFEGIWRFGKKEGPGLNPFILLAFPDYFISAPKSVFLQAPEVYRNYLGLWLGRSWFSGRFQN